MFFPTRKKEEGNPTHIAHIAKAPQANAQTKALPKSAIGQATKSLRCVLNFFRKSVKICQTLKIYDIFALKNTYSTKRLWALTTQEIQYLA